MVLLVGVALQLKRVVETSVVQYHVFRTGFSILIRLVSMMSFSSKATPTNNTNKF